MNQKKTKKVISKKKSYSNKIRITLVWTLIFFILTYSVLNKNTIGEQLTILFSVIKVFSSATFGLLINQNIEAKTNFETYEIEKEIHKLINIIRVDNQLNELEWDPYLGKLARDHSIDMATFNYFNHTNLIGLNPKDRAEILGIRTKITTETKIYTGVSENIGIMPRGIVKDVGVIITINDIAAATVYNWMTSEPHKKNILEKDLLFSGVGVAYDGKGNYYLTQDFQ